MELRAKLRKGSLLPCVLAAVIITTKVGHLSVKCGICAFEYLSLESRRLGALYAVCLPLSLLNCMGLFFRDAFS